MHHVAVNRNLSSQAHTRSASFRHADFNGGGLIRRLLTISVIKWQRRKVIAAFASMDPRLLRDIGIERCNIESVVDGFDHRERQMVPLARLRQAVNFDEPLRQAA